VKKEELISIEYGSSHIVEGEENNDEAPKIYP
jgi:hypothetical protein